MPLEGWLTVAVIVVMVVAMVRNIAGPDMVFVAGLTVLLAAGVIGPAEAFAGFSNSAIITIGTLFVVAAGVHETGALDFVGRRVLGRPRSRAAAQLRMMLPVSGMSAFLNNTPVVAMMVPLVIDWSRRSGFRASRLLMPLSYAAIMGGTCTLIGTSTNLVVAGMATARDPSLSFGMFDITRLGLPVLLVGTAYVVIASRWLLPDRGYDSQKGESFKEYTVSMRVQPESPVVGQTIGEAGLRQLPGLFLVEIERDDEVMPAVGPTTRLRAHDRLLFAGIVDSVVDLRKTRGLVPDTDQVDKLGGRPERRLVEAVVAPQSALVGKTVRETQFRTQYDAAIIAVHRQGERIRAKVGDIELQPGDVLLLEARPHFGRRYRHDPNFALLSEVENSAPPKHDKAWLAALIVLAMVVLHTANVVELVTAALLAAGAMLVTRCLTGAQARGALEIRVLLAIAAALGIGAALDESGAARAVAQAILGVGMPFGPIGVLGAIYVATAILAGVVTTTAAAALMFPIAAAAAESAGLDLKPLSFVVMLAASTAFSTPVGYQTNLMVYGPGGYHFGDFLRLGVPLQALIATVVVSLAYWLWL